MRKIIILFLALCMLTGCVVAQPVATEPITEPTEEVVKVAKCYFNEWILPALPKWDQDTYPYALIYQNKDSWGFYLMCLDTPFYVTTANGVQVIAFDVYAQVKAFEYWRSDPWEWKSTQYNAQPDSGAEAIYLNPDKAEYIWTNTDISDDYGTVVYPATDPVPIWEFNEKSFLIGYTLGIAGKPLPLTASKPSGEPVAYLYNGVRLPKLPEWDRGKYPWAVIVSFPTLGYRLSCFSSTARYYVDEASGLYSFGGTVENPVQCLVWNKRFTDTDWCDFEERTNHSVTVKSSSNPLLWASFDILDEDGIVYLAANNPTPVYE